MKGNTETIKNAITKAMANGWDAWGWPDFQVWGEDTVMFYDKTQEEDDTKWVRNGNELEFKTILFDHNFAEALWGTTPHWNGEPVLAELLVFEQVAIRHFGKLHAVSGARPHYAYLFQDDKARKLAENVVDEDSVKRFEYQLEKLSHTIPIETHHLSSVEALGTVPAWHYHLQQMVIAKRPIDYLAQTIAA